jgi:hypothetical protein
LPRADGAAAGFAGAHVAHALVRAGRRAIATDLAPRLPDRVMAALAGLGVRHIAGDLHNARRSPRCPVDAFQVRINGDRALKSSTASMVWPVARIVGFLSRTMTLWPGDVIATGTPAAGAIAVGDEVAVEFDGLGRLANPVVAGW